MPGKQKAHPLLIIVFVLFGLAAAAAAAGWFWWQNANKAVSPADTSKQRVVIPKGYGVTEIGTLLKEKGLIKDVLAFRILVKKENLGTKLQAGSYELSKAQTLEDIATSMTKGTEDLWVTIPEGKRREEVAKILVDAYLKEGLTFSVPDFMAATEGEEGYLFPDTYLFPKEMAASDIASYLRNTYDQKVNDDLKSQAPKLGLSMKQVIILASLVEREAKLDVDRPKIARVYLNRLAEGMPLQVDATIQYPVGTIRCQNKLGKDCDWWPKDDISANLKIRSPYNTYENDGLPPSPICNPGLSVIKAVLNPDDNDYLYYLSEDNGTTHYAKTLSEHEANIEKYLN